MDDVRMVMKFTTGLIPANEMRLTAVSEETVIIRVIQTCEIMLEI